MAKASRLSLGQNPTAAVASLKKNIHSLATSGEVQAWVTLEDLHSLLRLLVSRINNIIETSSPIQSPRENLEILNSSAMELFYKGMVEQRMSVANKKFISELDSLKTSLPMITDQLRMLLDDQIYTTIQRTIDDLEEADSEAARLFALRYSVKLGRALHVHSSALIEYNISLANKESIAVANAFFHRLEKQPPVNGSLTNYFNEFMQYFERTCLDTLGCRKPNNHSQIFVKQVDE